MHTRLDAVGWMARLVKPLVKQSATLALVYYTQAKEKEEKKSKLVRRLIAEKCLSVQLFL
jgi:hypothetical protein